MHYLSFECHRKVKQNENLCHVQDLLCLCSTSQPGSKVSLKGLLGGGAFITYCSISCLQTFLLHIILSYFASQRIQLPAVIQQYFAVVL